MFQFMSDSNDLSFKGYQTLRGKLNEGPRYFMQYQGSPNIHMAELVVNIW